MGKLINIAPWIAFKILVKLSKELLNSFIFKSIVSDSLRIETFFKVKSIDSITINSIINKNNEKNDEYNF